MKKLFAILTAAAAAAALTFSVSAEQGGSLVVLGDSIASGYGLEGYSAGDNTSAQDSFANKLAASYSSYENFAKDGRTTGELLTALEDEDVSAALSGADTVVISIGGNDFLQPMGKAIMSAVTENSDLADTFADADSEDFSALFDADSETASAISEIIQTVIDAANAVDTAGVVENLNGILTQVREYSPEAQVIILTVYDPFEGVTGMELLDVVAREKLAELNEGIAEAAEQSGAIVADVAAEFKGGAGEYTNILQGDIHPSKAGHEAVYELLCGIVGIDDTADTTEPSAAASADVSQKGSPDTGTQGIAAVIGAGAIFAAAAVMLRRR